MARIGIDARPLSEAAMSGIPRLVFQTVECLAAIGGRHEYVLYSHAPLRLVPDAARAWARHTGGGRIWGTVWIETVLPALLRRDRIDVYWGTEHVLPVLFTRGVKMVLTVHDLVPYLHPETMTRRNLVLNRLLFPPSLRAADAVVTVSDSTLRDLRRLFSLKAEIAETVHAGRTPSFAPPQDRGAAARLAESFSLNAPFILAVGTLEPRKNTIAAIRAFRSIAPNVPHDLVLVGGRGWKSGPLLEEIGRDANSSRIRMLGRVSDSALLDLYHAADVFVFPSLYEGFGSPVLEAMACGTPVITSNVSSLPEVAGDAAVLVDPLDPLALASALAAVLADPERRKEMSARGIARAKAFCWEDAARRMVGIFERVLG